MLVNERISPGTILEIYMKEEKGDRVGMDKKTGRGDPAVSTPYPCKDGKWDPDVHHPCGAEAIWDRDEEILRRRR